MTFICIKEYTSSNGIHYHQGERLTIHQYNEIPFSERDWYFKSEDALNIDPYRDQDRDADHREPDYRDDFYK